MRISRVKIKNFRSIQELDIELPQVCPLVRPNNVGKTNILEAIKRVLAGGWVRADDFSTDDIYLHDENRDIEIVCALDPPLQYVKFKNSDPVAIHTLSFKYTRYKVGQNNGEPRLEQQCLTAEGKQPAVLARAPRKGKKHAYEPLVGIPGDVRAQIPLIYIGTNRSLREQLPGALFPVTADLRRHQRKPARSGANHKSQKGRRDGNRSAASCTIPGTHGPGHGTSTHRTVQYRRAVDQVQRGE